MDSDNACFVDAQMVESFGKYASHNNILRANGGTRVLSLACRSPYPHSLSTSPARKPQSSSVFPQRKCFERDFRDGRQHLSLRLSGVFPLSLTYSPSPSLFCRLRALFLRRGRPHHGDAKQACSWKLTCARIGWKQPQQSPNLIL